jgi:hypothetical protein
VASMPDVSFSSGPICRPANSFACCSNRFILKGDLLEFKECAKVRGKGKRKKAVPTLTSWDEPLKNP